ncbi:hypothetical protein BJX64DRAFT_271115 [Aspergillus heterothallicus]
MSDRNDERRKQNPEEAVAEVQRLYDSGVAFFTKERIREAYEGIRGIGMSETEIQVREIDGKLDTFKMKNEDVFRDPEDDSKWLARPAIDFISIQNQLDPDRARVKSPYSNIRPVYLLVPSNRLEAELQEEEVNASLDKAIELWRRSRSWEQLRSGLARFKLGPITKIVAFGLGSMRAFSEENAQTNRSTVQHALLLTLCDLLISSTAQGTEINCYAQDPAYTEHDTAVLQSRGVTVVPDPEGFLEVDDQTAVISVSPNVPVRQVVSEIAQPRLMIWDAIRGDGFGELPMTDPASPRLQRLIHDHYETVDYLHERDYFRDVGIYVRRT